MFRYVAATIVLATIFVAVHPASADEYVNGYTRQDGTVVAPYMRSSPDGTTLNNYSHEGNVNPYTGEVGTKTDQDQNQ